MRNPSIIVDVISKEISNKIANMGFVCAILVLMIHIEYAKDCFSIFWLNKLISQIAVPFFFTVSGFLILNGYGEDGWYRNTLYKRVHSLLIPYIALNLLWFPFKVAIHAYGVRFCGADNSNPELVLSFFSFLQSFSLVAALGGPCVGPLWYVRALIWLVILSPAVAWMICRSKRSCIISIFGIIVLWILQDCYLQMHGGGGLWIIVFDVYFILHLACLRGDGQ